MLLFTIPIPIWFAVGGNWLDAEDVVVLDSAICNRAARVALMEIFAAMIQPEMRPSSKQSFPKAFFAWIMKRDIATRSLTIAGDSAPTFRMATYLQCKGKAIRNLKLSQWKFGPTYRQLHVHTYCTGLVSFCATDCTWSNGLMDILTANCVTLQSVRLENCQGRVDLNALPAFRNVHQVFVASKSPEDVPLGPLLASRCPSLTDLTLHGTVADGGGLAVVAQNCPSLTALSLGFCRNQIFGRDVAHLADTCNNLTSLSFEATKLSARDWTDMAPHLTRITSLTLKQEHGVSLSIVSEYCAPRLQRLTFTTESDEMKVTYLRDMLTACKQLSHLHIEEKHCLMIADNTFKIMAAQCGHSLKHLTVRNAPLFGPNDLVAVSAMCAELEHCDLGYCNVDGPSLLQLVKACPKLRFLSVEGAKISTDTAVQVVQSLPLLRYVNFSAPSTYPQGFSVEDAVAMLQGNREFKTLHISADHSTFPFSQQSLAQLRTVRPGLKVKLQQRIAVFILCAADEPGE